MTLLIVHIEVWELYGLQMIRLSTFTDSYKASAFFHVMKYMKWYVVKKACINSIFMNLGHAEQEMTSYLDKVPAEVTWRDTESLLARPAQVVANQGMSPSSVHDINYNGDPSE